MGTKRRKTSSVKIPRSNGHKTLVWLSLIEGVFALGVIYFAVTYSYWLLFLLLMVGVSQNSQRRILGLPEREDA